MSTQPNALRLANRLENDLEDREGSNIPMYAQAIADSAACELRAQHELIQKLTAALDGCIDEAEDAITRHILSFGERYKPARIAEMRKQVSDARAALAAAEAHK